ncbi:hypothetical protein JH06_2165 [Blastocystis sp. subtype 4]|uniref:hypothetical protein n=1 Tax=Blastocystis sp. subtype 4 TaxID=944170 RepID=UPI0007112AB4|nr:hypothetical protein JH06_2165 [Blastocystis sp. subtype 4]KNB43884.1 hypothetical protein JH06_2165 [Blastocystis sp. subtype 4]|eukprot:XP_014527327.1 hypothetical protein JH06_2165 [Blastocystis sp. subtype 4]
MVKVKLKEDALFCGDIEGHLQEAMDRVRKVNGSKAGPFDVLFCIGRFLDENNSIPLNIDFPIPTYVVLKDETLSPELKDHFAGMTNVTIVTDVDYIQFKDLIVLCIPGVYDPEHYLDEAHISSAYYRKSQIDRVLATIPQTGVDFVLSAEWSYGMLHHLDSTRFPTIPDCTTVGSPIISSVLKTVCPRYHFAGSLNTFYERLPYRNPDDTISRIVCLGPVKAGGDKSRKWIHALNVTPRNQMKREDLCSIDVFFTPSPFETLKRGQNETEDRQKRMRSQDENPNYRFDLQRNNTCWFCLAAPNVEKQLIVSVSEGAYLAVPKGQLCPNHLLVIPVVHRQSSLQLPPEALEDVERFKRALAVLLWERNLTTRNPVHCHIQILPFDASKDAAATQRGFRFSDIPENQSLREFAGEDDYLYAEVYGVGEDQPKRIGYVVRERRPNMQFFHQAVGSLLEAENVGEDWKSLQKSPEEEAKVTEKVRELFKPYDFTLTRNEFIVSYSTKFVPTNGRRAR